MGKKSHPLSPATATTCYHPTYKGGEGEGAQHPPSPPYSRLLIHTDPLTGRGRCWEMPLHLKDNLNYHNLLDRNEGRIRLPKRMNFQKSSKRP